MRPAGEVRQALFSACQRLATPARGVTLQEMARGACVGLQAARHTVQAMRRAGQITPLQERAVAYRNRKVLEYVPASMAEPGPTCTEGAGAAALGHALLAWKG